MFSFGPHVFALAEILAGQLVEQPAVHVVADAERENAGVDLVVSSCASATIFASFVSPTVGRPSVRKMHEVRPARIVQLRRAPLVSAPLMFVLPPA